MRCTGRGHGGLRKFCRVMNFPAPVTEKAYRSHQEVVLAASVKLAETDMVQSAAELRAMTDSTHVAVTFDGTWMRRGYSSLYGVFACISFQSGRVLDITVKGRYCHECKIWTEKKRSGAITEEAFSTWLDNHKCSINTAASAPGMESEAACDIWQRSVGTRGGLMYTSYIGDGDSKGYKKVCDLDPYDGVAISKEECIGHVQKRVGNRLRELKRQHKGMKLSDGIGLSGKGRLTDRQMERLQTNYGNAVRRNVGDLQAMAKEIWAGLMHCCSTDATPQHQFCPEGPDSWCKWQQAQSGARQAYEHKNPLPKAVFEVVKPIYMQLSERSLLERCQMGATQNANESFNNVIWRMCPKEGFCSVDTVQLASSLAVLNFNNGAITLLSVLKECGCIDGNHTKAALELEDQWRVKKSLRKSSAVEKESRKRRRRQRKGWEETTIEKEGTTYDKGGF